MTTRAQVTFKAASGLPEDNVVNTFHFGQPGAGKFPPGEVAQVVRNFYQTLWNGMSFPLERYLGEHIARDEPSEIDLYDLNDPEPRVPYDHLAWTPAQPHGTSNFPGEVALCLSWKADAVSGVPLGRLRGRTYLGPLIVDAGLISGAEVRPTPQLLDDARTAMGNLIDTANGEFVIFSRTAIPDLASPVTSGYVDNAFDTIRSRGAAPTQRYPDRVVAV